MKLDSTKIKSILKENSLSDYSSKDVLNDEYETKTLPIDQVIDSNNNQKRIYQNDVKEITYLKMPTD